MRAFSACARSRARLAIACCTATSNGRRSIVNSNCPLRTSSPARKCTAVSSPETCAFTATVVYASTLPMARACTGTAFCVTVATLTGTAGGAAGAAWGFEQPAAASRPRKQARVARLCAHFAVCVVVELVACSFKSFSMLTGRLSEAGILPVMGGRRAGRSPSLPYRCALAAKVTGTRFGPPQRAGHKRDAPLACGPRAHALHPNLRQRAANTVRVKLLVTPAAEQLLNEEVVDHHTEKHARRQQRVDTPKLARADALPDVLGQGLVIAGHMRAEKTVGKPVVIERAEEQQARERSVFGIAAQDALGNRGEGFLRI